jgi:hypothetical protein
MFDVHQTSTGPRYTATVALLTVAFVFIPAILLVSRPFGNVALSLAIVCSAACVMFARSNFKAIAIKRAK